VIGPRRLGTYAGVAAACSFLPNGCAAVVGIGDISAGPDGGDSGGASGSGSRSGGSSGSGGGSGSSSGASGSVGDDGSSSSSSSGSSLGTSSSGGISSADGATTPSDAARDQRITCGTLPACDSTVQVCCVTPSGESCIAANDTCTGDKIACSGTNSCSTGICCEVALGRTGVQATCLATCPTGAVQLCTTNSECSHTTDVCRAAGAYGACESDTTPPLKDAGGG
jgi:hypothetical protein